MQLIYFFFFCSFSDANPNLYVEHLLFGKDSDVESGGAQPFQLVVHVNSQYPGTSTMAKG